MHGCTTPSSRYNRMLKKSASFVLASLRDSTYRKGTPRLFARCGRADGLFEHPVGYRQLARTSHSPSLKGAKFVSRSLLNGRVGDRCG